MATNQSKQQVVDLTKLNIEQLTSLQQRFEEERNYLVESFRQLQTAIGRYQDTQQCLGSVSQENAGKDVLIPVTGSMFVPGKIGDIDSVIIDIGTGYYVKHQVKDAVGFTDRRIKLLEDQSEIVKKNLAEKRQGLENIITMRETKIQEAQKGAKQTEEK